MIKKNRSHIRHKAGTSGNYRRMHTIMNRAIKVPDRGKIRVFLVLLLIAAAGKEVLSFVVDKVVPSPEKRVAMQAEKMNRRNLLEGKKKDEKIVEAKWFKYEDLITTIDEHPPTLQAAVDTVEWKKSKVIRYFSIDTALQKTGEKLMKRHSPNHCGMVIIQPRTGRVLSLISYNNPKVAKFRDELYTNAELPAASIFKTITAAAVIEKNGLTADYEFPITGNAHTLYKNQIAKDIKPTYKMSFSDAYAFSVNPIFARMGLYHAGIGTLQEYAEKFGFNDSIPFELPVGISRFTPVVDTFAIAELASGYNNNTTLSPMLGALIAGGVANGGRIVRPTLVDSVVDLQTGRKLYQVERRPWRVIMSEQGAATLKGIMQATTKKGTARRGFATIKGTRAFDHFQHGGKTGNLNTDPELVKGRVEWFVGFLKDSNLEDEDLACGIVQVHGAIWHVHSSFLADEMLRTGIKEIQRHKKEAAEQADSAKAARTAPAPQPDTSKSKQKS